MNDREIVDLYWRRSEQAIKESIQKYGRFCHIIAYNILENTEDSEECVNDTWLSAWNSMPDNRPAPDGSLEFDFRISAGDLWESFEGRKVRIVIDGLGVGEKLQYEPLVTGPWELAWTIRSNHDVLDVRRDAEIGNTGITLTAYEIAPVSAKVTLKLAEAWEGYMTLGHFDLQLVGVRLGGRHYVSEHLWTAFQGEPFRPGRGHSGDHYTIFRINTFTY